LERYISSNFGSDDCSVMVMSLLGACFSTEMPFCTTSAGRRDSAFLSRFWMSTAARSASVAMSKVTVAEKPPELELDDSM
jgi:hypothetical protein